MFNFDLDNDAFYHAAFTTAEKELVKPTRCTDNGEGSPDTQDRVFLLSVAEVKEFTDAQDGNRTAIRRRTVGTEFAKTRKTDGCHLYVYDKGVEKDYIVLLFRVRNYSKVVDNDGPREGYSSA